MLHCRLCRGDHRAAPTPLAVVVDGFDDVEDWQGSDNGSTEDDVHPNDEEGL